MILTSKKNDVIKQIVHEFKLQIGAITNPQNLSGTPSFARVQPMPKSLVTALLASFTHFAPTKTLC
jgi:hypothetical protein